MSTMILNAESVKPPQTRTTYLAILFAVCFISSALGGTVSTLMSVYLPVVVKDLQGDLSPNDLNSISGYINALFIFGWAFGGFSWGLISDKIGRKKALLCAIACYGLFTFLTGLMPQWLGVVVCRFMSGFGVGGVLVVSFTLLSEVWPQKSRAVVTGIISIAFPVGIFSAGLINYVVTSWRAGFFIGAVPVILAIAGVWLIHESDKWLSHREEKASDSKRSLWYSAENRRELLIGSLMFGSMLIGLWAIFSWMPTWIQSLIATDAPKQRGLSMMFLGMGGLTGGFLSGWLVNLLGLKKSMTLCFAVCAVMSFVLFKTNTVFSGKIYAEIAIMALFFGASQGVLSAYIPQLFHTGIRATATGFCFNIGRLFTASAVLFIGVLVTSLGGYGNAIFIFSLVFIIGLVVVLLMKDKAPAAEVSEINVLSGSK
ncbi:MAG: MFS transporter [Mucilaginibacter sp.]